MKHLTQNKGFTLVEILVAVAIFSLVISSISGIFISNLKAQRQSLASQELFDQTSYLMEYMSRALRMARKDLSGACTGTAKLNYSFSGQCLKFRNYKDSCQQFCLTSQRLWDGSQDYFTSPQMKVLRFNVNLSGQTQNDNLQPRVTFLLEVEGKESSRVQLQTSVSQRNQDVRK